MAAAEKADVLDDVAALVNSRERWAKAEIHMRQKAMLSITGAHTHRPQIAILNLNNSSGACCESKDLAGAFMLYSFS